MSVKEAVVAYFGPVLYEFYGSSELGVNTILKPDDVLRKPGSCGEAAPGKEIALLDDDGRPVPVGEPGELHVKKFAGILDEYYKDPAATAKLCRGDWYSVGDVAYVDADGFYYICDRKRDMIISAGVNIYPAYPTTSGESACTRPSSRGWERIRRPRTSSNSRDGTWPDTRCRAR
jgi:acyl-CoA synthetase (AMP-forming)/AMP-acid ligase II